MGQNIFNNAISISVFQNIDSTAIDQQFLKSDSNFGTVARQAKIGNMLLSINQGFSWFWRDPWRRLWAFPMLLKALLTTQVHLDDPGCPPGLLSV